MTHKLTHKAQAQRQPTMPDNPKTDDDPEREDRMEEALHRIASWAEAYPLQVFPEPDAAYYAKARAVLEANGMTLDRLSAAAMRHVITQVGHIAKKALNDA